MNPQTGQVPTPTNDEPGQEPAVEAAPANPTEIKTYDETYVKKLRDEAAGYRTKLRDYEKADEDRRQASLSETQKATERAEAAEQALQTAQERVNRSAILIAARDKGAVDADAVYALLDKSNLDMTDDAAVSTAVDALLTAKPYLKAAQEAPKPVAPKTSPISPPRSQTPSWAGRGNRL